MKQNFDRWVKDNPDLFLKDIKEIKEQVKVKFPDSSNTLLKTDTYSISILRTKLRRMDIIY